MSQMLAMPNNPLQGMPNILKDLFAAKSKQVLADLAHLNFFGTLGDSVAAVVSIDVLKRHVSAVADSPACLHCSIGSVADQTVSPVITHRHQVRELHKTFNIGTIALHRIVHERCGVANELTQHGGFSVQLNQRELDSLIARQFLPPRHS